MSLCQKVGKIDINNPDKIFMTNVIATIYLVDSSPLKITSNYANYNKMLIMKLAFLRTLM